LYLGLQVGALALLGSRCWPPRAAHKAADTAAAFHTVLPRLLAAAGSARRPVRAAALAALPAAASQLRGGRAEAALAGPHLAELTAAISAQREMFEADSQALEGLLLQWLQQARQAQPSVAATPAKSSKRGKGAPAPGTAADDR